jgi:hypothetical protein
MKTAQQRDMEKFLHEGVQKLIMDFRWRCEALDIETEIFAAVVTKVFLTYGIATSLAMMPAHKTKRAIAEAQLREAFMELVNHEIVKYNEFRQSR